MPQSGCDGMWEPLFIKNTYTRASKRVLGLGKRHTIDHRPYIKEVITWPAFAFYISYTICALVASFSWSPPIPVVPSLPREFPSKCKTCLVGNSRNERAACTHKFHFLYARKIAVAALYRSNEKFPLFSPSFYCVHFWEESWIECP